MVYTIKCWMCLDTDGVYRQVLECVLDHSVCKTKTWLFFNVWLNTCVWICLDTDGVYGQMLKCLQMVYTVKCWNVFRYRWCIRSNVEMSSDTDGVYGLVPQRIIDEEDEKLRAWTQDTDLVSAHSYACILSLLLVNNQYKSIVFRSCEVYYIMVR